MKIYPSSKIAHASIWKAMRDAGGYDINATWINYEIVERGKSCDILWQECIAQVLDCDLFFIYHQNGEALKGAFIELGIALTSPKQPIIVMVGMDEYTISDYRHNDRIKLFDSMSSAVGFINSVIAERENGNEQIA